MAQIAIQLPHRAELRLRMTYEEYRATVPESAHSEWVDGEAIVFVSPTRMHQRIIRFLTRLLSDFAEEFVLGEVVVSPFEMKLRDGRSYREPDLLFVRSDRLDAMDEDRLNGPADLAVEVISPDSVMRDWEEKRLEYEAAGVTEYWVIDPRRGRERTSVYALDASGRFAEFNPDGDGRLWSRVLPGLWIEAAWFTADPLPSPRALLHRMAPDRFLWPSATSQPPS